MWKLFNEVQHTATKISSNRYKELCDVGKNIIWWVEGQKTKDFNS